MNFLDPQLPSRFWSKAMPCPMSGCWLWFGAIDSDGYGNWWDGEKYVKPHRVTYELGHGPIADGLVIDHKCRTRSCCNPDHVEPVTNAVNVQRGADYAWSQKQLCAAGHELTEANTLLKDNKRHRTCRECNRLRAAKWREEQKRSS